MILPWPKRPRALTGRDVVEDVARLTLKAAAEMAAVVGRRSLQASAAYVAGWEACAAEIAEKIADMRPGPPEG